MAYTVHSFNLRKKHPWSKEASEKATTDAVSQQHHQAKEQRISLRPGHAARSLAIAIPEKSEIRRLANVFPTENKVISLYNSAEKEKYKNFLPYTRYTSLLFSHTYLYMIFF